jgi:5'(3')-deoxyribonucleotidase
VLRLGVDLDNTLADFTKNSFSRFEKEFGIRLKPKDWERISTGEFARYLSSITDISYEDVKQWIYEEMDKPGFFFEQDPVDGFYHFYDFYHEFKDDIDLYFVTSVPITSTHAYKDKYRWASKHMTIQKPQMIYTKFKHLVAVDVLIDDHTENCDMWIEDGDPERIFMLFPQPYNKEYYESLDPDSGVYRPEGWKEICDHLQQTLI